MDVTGVTNAATSAPSASDAAMNALKPQLDTNAFMKLFLESLKNQDPESPMDNAQMMSQLAQISNLEQITNLTDAVKKFTSTMLISQVEQGSSLLGKNVTGSDDDGNLVSGTPTSVEINNGLVNLMINGKEIEVGKITKITT